MATSEQEKPNPTTNQPEAEPKDGKKGKWGYDLYPERRGDFKNSISNVVLMKEGRETMDRIRCERNIYNCVKKSPLVKLMMGALKASGWYDVFFVMHVFVHVWPFE